MKTIIFHVPESYQHPLPMFAALQPLSQSLQYQADVELWCNSFCTMHWLDSGDSDPDTYLQNTNFCNSVY